VNFLLLIVVAVAAAQWRQGRQEPLTARDMGRPVVVTADTTAPPGPRHDTSGYPSFLPYEAIETIELIERGGPFPFARDASEFQNRERRLPARPRGYYREYTVRTPGARDRAARRIVSGGNPPEVYYYTDDHYQTFQRVEVGR
jgi:ribonuclease T1